MNPRRNHSPLVVAGIVAALLGGVMLLEVMTVPAEIIANSSEVVAGTD